MEQAARKGRQGFRKTFDILVRCHTVPNLSFPAAAEPSGTCVPHTDSSTSGKKFDGVPAACSRSAAQVLQTSSTSVPSYMARNSDSAHAEKSSRLDTSASRMLPSGPEVTFAVRCGAVRCGKYEMRREGGCVWAATTPFVGHRRIDKSCRPSTKGIDQSEQSTTRPCPFREEGTL